VPSYEVKVAVKATMLYEVEADNKKDAEEEARAQAENGDMPNMFDCDEVVKVGKAKRLPD